MKLETALKLYDKLEQEFPSQNLFARANSRYILFGVNEPRENFPPTLESNLNFGSDSLAFSYLSIGCCMFEKEYNESSNGKEIRRIALEKGAEFIEYNHFYEQNRNDLSAYYLLVGALAYYAASQYSKAFVLMKKVNDLYETDVSILTSAFLKKDFNTVFEVLNKILLNENYIEQLDNEQTVDDRIQVILYARAFANLMDFLYFGNLESLTKTKEILTDLIELLAIENEPSMWWIVRLLIIIIGGFEDSSLWTTILPRIPDDEKSLSTKFIRNLVFAKNPIIELFAVQRKSLDKVLSEKGAVVSLPTSSGKTRIAEIAILESLTNNPKGKILYLAPFRSLAYEVENSLNQTFEKIGFVVSQLYGTGQFSQLDRAIIEEANILIATPEKTKVILRANDDIAQKIKLVIIDEGHLLNEQERQVRNEMFVEELKKYVLNNNGKIILLSAVLPNTEEIAKWITDAEYPSFITDTERVARQRLGILEFREHHVNLDWLGEEKSYNPSFVKPIIPLTKKGIPKKNGKIRPSSKEEGVAHTALKLSHEHPLLIFIANARSVLTYADEVYKAMKRSNELAEHVWKNQSDWNTFQLICNENNYGENAEILKYAQYGILCHKSNINQELKTIIEKLMRTDSPRVIIATMTLGQGVNLGVSTVIFAGINFYDIKTNGWKNIDKKDFWNIAGRVGRAFTETDGKILFATENSTENNNALTYFNEQPNRTLSGLLKQIVHIKKIAKSCNVDFATLLELIANDDFVTFSKWKYESTDVIVSEEFRDFFDWIDDPLLSLDLEFEKTPTISIDDYFRRSLAYIQAETMKDFDKEDVISFLNARRKAIREIVARDKNLKRLVSSGLPLATAVKLDDILGDIKTLADNYLNSSMNIEDKVNMLSNIDEIIKQMPSVVFSKNKFSLEEIKQTRNIWLSGESLINFSYIKDSQKICNHYFAYTFSWFLGAVANRFRREELEEYIPYADLFEELAICSELGLPDLKSAKIYLAGIRSRVASTEISMTPPFLTFSGNLKIPDFVNQMIENITTIKKEVKNEITLEWLNIFIKENFEKRKNQQEESLSIFIKNDIKVNRLFVREFDKELYFCSSDYEEKFLIPVEENDIHKNYKNKNNIFFEYNGINWSLERL